MAASVISICNLALSRIGQQPIQSLSEPSAEAAACKALYEVARDETLAAIDWSWARARVALAEMGDTPAGWAHRYALPADALVVRALVAAPGERQPAWCIEGPALLTNAAAASLLYTAAVTDPLRYPVPFITVMSWKLAADLSVTQTGREALHQRCVAMWQQSLAKAAADDANIGVIEPRSDDAVWIAARD